MRKHIEPSIQKHEKQLNKSRSSSQLVESYIDIQILRLLWFTMRYVEVPTNHESHVFFSKRTKRLWKTSDLTTKLLMWALQWIPIPRVHVTTSLPPRNKDSILRPETTQEKWEGVPKPGSWLRPQGWDFEQPSHWICCSNWPVPCRRCTFLYVSYGDLSVSVGHLFLAPWILRKFLLAKLGH